MSDDDETWREQFESLGVNQVRAQLLEWTGPFRAAATRWLAGKDQEAARLEEASRAAQIESAREANSIAREAAASAALAARLARTNNRIAMAAVIIAVIAVVISIASIFIKP
jgi:hypothetical protein